MDDALTLRPTGQPVESTVAVIQRNCTYLTLSRPLLSITVITALLFALGKWALGFYLGSGSAASAYGAASSLITLLLWVYYSSQILLFGAEFTQVYADYFGARVLPDEHAVRVQRTEVEQPKNSRDKG